MMHTWTDDDFEQSVLSNGTVAVVGFFRADCASCKQMTPILQQLADDVPEIMVGMVIMNDSTAIADRFQVRSTPTTIIFSNGEARESFVGIRQKVELASTLRSILD